MIYIVIVLLAAIILLPGIWVKKTINKYTKELPDLPGTGGQFAEHLLKRFEINDIQVEQGQENGDHYSPNEKRIRLSPVIYSGKSISAMAIAAHEVGHAIQYHRKESITHLREKLTPVAFVAEKISLGLLTLSPFLILIFGVPHIGIFAILASLISLALSVIVQFIILPMEWDASFNKALPIIIEGEYLSESEIPAARKILRAAAMTYVAATLSSILSIWRWLLLLRR
jgi:Zn-dependent membrane protease YugP|tara:strand:+ start:395 stop:1078 length:684 start_codon:yes stop_codon:yes gene_type:complete